MITEFVFWLKSIVEDDPLPYEISSICFCYVQNGMAKTLMMGGCEFRPKINYLFDYYPLEAQYFDCKLLRQFENEKSFKQLICQVIDESFADDYLKKEFYGKKIYFGEYNKRLKYLFTVK